MDPPSGRPRGLFARYCLCIRSGRGKCLSLAPHRHGLAENCLRPALGQSDGAAALESGAVRLVRGRTVNTEQASKEPMWEPTRRNNGEGRCHRGSERDTQPGGPTGVMVAARTEHGQCATREVCRRGKGEEPNPTTNP